MSDSYRGIDDDNYDDTDLNSEDTQAWSADDFNPETREFEPVTLEENYDYLPEEEPDATLEESLDYLAWENLPEEQKSRRLLGKY